MLMYLFIISYLGGKQGTHNVLTTLKSSSISNLISSKYLISQCLLSSLSSTWVPSILVATDFSSIWNSIFFHLFGLPGGKNPDCFSCFKASSSDFSSRSIILRTVTITLGSLRTVFNVLDSINFICFSSSCDSTSTWAKYSFNMPLSWGDWLGNLCNSYSKSSLDVSKSLRLYN